MSWWDSWLECKAWSPWDYDNWKGERMLVSTEQDHERRLKRLEQRMDNHIERDRPGAIYCCMWMYHRVQEGAKSVYWEYCPKCGQRLGMHYA